MPHDVFISYASPDKQSADAVCGTLEQQGIRCCIFPRDGVPGQSFAESITNFLSQCKVMVLVLSSHANCSKHISREVEMAVRRGLTVIPFRIEDVKPTGSLEYWISEAHWLDAITPEMERGLKKLVTWVKPHMSEDEAKPATNENGKGQYHLAMKMAWADEHLDEAEIRNLRLLARQFELNTETCQAIEREVMGNTIQEIEQQTQQMAEASAGSTAAPTTKKIFCRKCGNRLINEARFCRLCGTQVPE